MAKCSAGPNRFPRVDPPFFGIAARWTFGGQYGGLVGPAGLEPATDGYARTIALQAPPEKRLRQ